MNIVEQMRSIFVNAFLTVPAAAGKRAPFEAKKAPFLAIFLPNPVDFIKQY